MIGSRLKHYEIVGHLGKGGMGEVFVAYDSKLDRRVALKVLPPEMARDADRRARFEREARSVAALNHPNIVTIHSVEHDGPSTGSGQVVHFITMELVEGQPLSSRILPDGLPFDDLLEIAVPLADAVAAAHEKGITHRDLKPDNVMLTADGRLKVLDFGLAKQTVDVTTGPDDETQLADAHLTREGRIVGTVAYMSPEQAEGRAVDPRSDVFSLGVMLYELATGQRPFRGDTPLSTLSAILKDSPQPAYDVKPGLPRDLGRILDRCLAKDPGSRYPNAAELRQELVAMSDTAPASQKSWWLPLLLTLVGLFAVVWVVQQFSAEKTTPPAPAAITQAAQQSRASIAVLPFVNMSADPANEYLSDGLAETLMHKLAQLRNLRVAARTSSFAFKGRNEDVRKIAEALDVSSILEGSVQKSGDRLRITVQLIDAADGSHLLSRSFDRTGEDVFAIQDEIAQEVVTALRVELLGSESERLRTRDTDSVEAFNAYLLGLQRMNAQGWSNYEAALEYFEQAVELDPGYAIAWVRIAQLRVRMIGTGLITEAEGLDGAIPAVDRALSLDPELAEAFALRGEIRARQGRRVEAEADHDRSMQLDPDSSEVRIGYSTFLTSALRFDEVLTLVQPAIQADPLNSWLLALEAIGYEGTGRFNEARRVIDRIREVDTKTPRGYYGVAYIEYYAYGEVARAIPWMLQALEVDPQDYELPASLVRLYLDLGDMNSAKRYLDRALEMGPQGARPRMSEVRYLERAGRTDEARRLAQELITDTAFPQRQSRAELLRSATVDMHASAAAKLYEQLFPALRSRTPFAEQSWTWTRPPHQYVRAEVDLARLQLALGQRDAAETLLDDAEAFTHLLPRMGRMGYAVLDAEIAAVRGDDDRAMTLLREAVNAGWVVSWWWELGHNQNLASLHDRVDYRDLVEELESKMVRQRATLQ